MNYRTLGRTGLTVSEIGFGGWGIGNSMWLGADDQESLLALHKAIDLGLTFIDTAPGYGNGHSERLIGQVVKEREEPIYVATKVPPKNYQWPALPGVHVSETFPQDHVIASTEQSLLNLGLEKIDLLQFHVWNDEWVNQGDWLAGVQKLKEQGKIGFFGVSINNHQPSNVIELIKTGTLDTVQVIYNLFDQSAENELLPLCQEYNVGVIVRVPLDEGGLTGSVQEDTTFPEGDFRNAYFHGERKRQVAVRNRGIVEDVGISLEELPELALRYVLAHPSVSTVIPGMRSVRNVIRNSAVSDGKKLGTETMQKLKNHRWERNFHS